MRSLLTLIFICPLAAAQSVDPQEAANQLWASLLTPCGDSYYQGSAGESGQIKRYRQPEFPPPVADQLTEADRAAGYQWRGWAFVTGKRWTSYTRDKGWSAWMDSAEDATRKDVLLKVEMSNRNGSWHFQNAGPSPDSIAVDPEHPAKKLTCAEIPENPSATGQEKRSTGGGVSQPSVISKVDPKYSQEARRKRQQGTVLLHIVVDIDGRAKNIKVLQGIGYGLDEKAIEAVKKWKFKPGEKDGKPVPVYATVEVNFRFLNHP